MLKTFVVFFLFSNSNNQEGTVNEEGNIGQGINKKDKEIILSMDGIPHRQNIENNKHLLENRGRKVGSYW